MIASIRANQFLRRELRRSEIKWTFICLRVIPLSFLTLVALIPVFYYIDDSRVNWLPWMAIILFMPRPILAIRTIFAGIQSVRQDIIQGRWELLILTGIPARKIVWSKWIKVVRQTFPDHLLFALPSIGLALGISQFFQASTFQCHFYEGSYDLPVYVTIKLLFNPYCYNSLTYYYGSQLAPSGIVFIIGILLILLMTLCETSLNASLSMLAGFSNFAAKGLGIVYGIIIRGSLLGIAFLAIPLMRDYVSQIFACNQVTFISNFACQAGSYQMRSIYHRGTDTVEVAIMPLFDQGTLLAANVMRPNDDRILKIYFHAPNERNLKYWEPFKYKTSHIDAIKSYYDNRPFVFRNVMALGISGLFYCLLIRYFLRRATRFAIVNHGASGYLEL